MATPALNPSLTHPRTPSPAIRDGRGPERVAVVENAAPVPHRPLGFAIAQATEPPPEPPAEAPPADGPLLWEGDQT